jgi:hypothetical protein
MADEDRVPGRRRSFRAEEVDDEVLLFDKVSKRTVYLNGSAAVIWKLCDGKRSVREIVDILKQAYPDAPDDFATDVHYTLEQLTGEGALRWEPEATLSEDAAAD